MASMDLHGLNGGSGCDDLGIDCRSQQSGAALHAFLTNDRSIMPITPCDVRVMLGSGPEIESWRVCVLGRHQMVHRFVAFNRAEFQNAWPYAACVFPLISCSFHDSLPVRPLIDISPSIAYGCLFILHPSRQCYAI